MVIGEFGQEVLTGGGLKFELVQLNAWFVSLWIVKRLKKQKQLSTDIPFFSLITLVRSGSAWVMPDTPR